MAGLMIVGQVTGRGSRKAGREGGEQWDEHYIVVLNGAYTMEVRVASIEKFKGQVPEAGEVVALEVAVETFLRREQIAQVSRGERCKPSYKFVCFGRNAEVEAGLTGSATLTAVKAG